jgi:uncharacterized repeat protein (TIGR04138 family)
MASHASFPLVFPPILCKSYGGGDMEPPEKDPNETIRGIVREDGRYEIEAFYFLFRALSHAADRLGHDMGDTHISGNDLLDAAENLARREFGFLAKLVFNSWGLHDTRDIGNIVFLLVDKSLMGSTANDSIEDFVDGFDFAESFERELHLDFSTH